MTFYHKGGVFVIFFMVAMLIFSVSAVAQKMCLFFSKAAPDTQDFVLIEELKNNYELVVHDILDLKNDIIDIDYVKMFDFAFVSETISSADAGKLKCAPVPIFTTELYISKWDIMGWVPVNENIYYGNTAEGENTVIIADGGHFLAAGFETGTEIDLITGGTSKDWLTYSVPEIDFIQIAILLADPSKTIVMGIEQGTVLFNDENVKDGSMVTENRIAAVGIDSDSYLFMTTEAFQLINAGIQWVLKLDTGVEEENSYLKPHEFSLGQNYPNPFNPSTTIEFTLTKPGYTTIVIYDVNGKPVKKLVDAHLTRGRHSIIFNGKDLASGVYYYKILSGEFTNINKMMLLK